MVPASAAVPAPFPGLILPLACHLSAQFHPLSTFLHPEKPLPLLGGDTHHLWLFIVSSGQVAVPASLPDLILPLVCLPSAQFLLLFAFLCLEKPSHCLAGHSPFGDCSWCLPGAGFSACTAICHRWASVLKHFCNTQCHCCECTTSAGAT